MNLCDTPVNKTNDFVRVRIGHEVNMLLNLNN